MKRAASRNTQEVIDDHLARQCASELQQDLELNYSAEVVLLTDYGVLHGHDGVRLWAKRFQESLPNLTPQCTRRFVAHDVARVEWTVGAGELRIVDGVDTFVVRDGRIAIQTVHFAVTAKSVAARAAQDAHLHVLGIELVLPTLPSG